MPLLAIPRPWKVLIVGHGGAGKTSLLLRLTENCFNEDPQITLPDDLVNYDLDLAAGQSTRLQFWDTNGQEKFRTITAGYYRGAHGVMIVYDPSSPNGLESINQWVEAVVRYAPPEVCVVFVANKMDVDASAKDDPGHMEHIKEDVKQYKDMLQATYIVHPELFYTSAKTGEGVREAFSVLANMIIKKNGEDEPIERSADRASLKVRDDDAMEE